MRCIISMTSRPNATLVSMNVRTGPPAAKPAWFCLVVGRRGWKKLRALSFSLRRNSQALPWSWLVPLLIWTFTAAPPARLLMLDIGGGFPVEFNIRGPDWDTLDDERRAQRYQDYVIVNRVICATLDAVQDGVVERFEAFVERFYRPQLDGDRARWTLSLQPRELRMRSMVSRIRISGSADRLTGIEIEETRGDRSVMTVVEEPS